MGLFLAEGERTVDQILQNGQLEIEAVIVGETRLSKGSIGHHCLTAIKPLFSATSEQIATLSDTETPQEVMAICRIPALLTEIQLVRRPNSATGFTLPIILALDGIQDPGNMGTILRSAAWFGVQGLLFGKGNVDPWNPKVVRSSVGGIAGIAAAEGNLQESIGRLKELGCRICSLELGEGAISLTQFLKTVFEEEATQENKNQKMPWVVVVGNEANGISAEVSVMSDARVKIEGSQDGAVESLNVGVSAGIALYAILHTILSKHKL